jgi:pimeloyl-ACP methyl ester carboxylesterase
MPTLTAQAGPDAAAAAHVPDWLDRDAYPFQHRWLALANGRRLHYIDEGEGDAILLVHGTPSWSFEWRHVVRALSASHRCIAPDLLGFGLSDRPADFPYTPEAHAEVLAAFVERLGLRDVTLVVHDFGGPIGLPLALRDATPVRRLVVVNSWMWSFAGDADMERKARFAGGAVGRFLYRRLNASLRLIMPSAYGDRRKLTPAIHRQYLGPFPDAWSRGAVLWPLARALLASSAYYERLWSRREQLRTLPALIVWGTKDSAFRPAQLARWREALPHARVVELPVGHWPQEEAPDEVVAALRAFLHDRPVTRQP